jgi:hypothetical protein
MNGYSNTATQKPVSSFSFAALIAAVFQLNLRDKLSKGDRGDGAYTWGL